MSEFFLNRYRKIDRDVKIINPDDVKQALRVNTKKITSKKLLSNLKNKDVELEKIEFLKNGYFASANFSLGATPDYLFGHYYLQSPLSQLACEILNPKGNVLDMASAPGGKTTYLATLTDGFVVALDNNAARLATVRNNVERLGITNVICVKKDARFAPDLGIKFPFVLLDAPCSGNFCSEPDWFSKRTIDDVKRNSRVQKELIKSAYACLEPGGKLLYSTCSLEPEENELVISWAIDKFELDVIPLNFGDPGITKWDKVLSKKIIGTRRFWPHKTGMEGFYIALLKKVGHR